MQIDRASLDLSARHTREESRTTAESLRFSSGSPTALALPAAEDLPSTAVTLSEAGRAAQSAAALDDELDQAVDRDPRLNLLRRMMEALTGEKIRVFDVAEFEASQASRREASVRLEAAASAAPSGAGLAYDYRETYTETQETRFAASGTVVTRDGQRFSFTLELSASYEYREERSFSLRLGEAARQRDPLVLNFDGSGAQLQDWRFAFDLDADGQRERINPLRPGSAFLVFDRNRDNRANDGLELFGPTSGNGFRELAALDDDKNGWIDENDRAFADLKLWQPDATGQGRLESLAERGVGALSLAAVDTPFSLKDGRNALLGEWRSTGLFLQEDGKPGALQQVDLTV